MASVRGESLIEIGKNDGGDALTLGGRLMCTLRFATVHVRGQSCGYVVIITHCERNARTV